MGTKMLRWEKLLDASRRTALLVEDDPRLQHALSKQLAEMDFHVFAASHYDGAVRHLARLEPQVVCIDVGLPNKSGFELCEYIRKPLGLARLPILLMSESGTSTDKAYAEEAGGNEFLHKPFSMTRFKQCVESLSKGYTPSPPAPLQNHEARLLGYAQIRRDPRPTQPGVFAHFVGESYDARSRVSNQVGEESRR